MAADETLWEADPHTLAKIRIVEEYLKAWFPILSTWEKRINYIDAFSGPGEYANGHKGSPIAAIETALSHSRSLSDRQINFAFIDADPRRSAHLKGLVAQIPLPNWIKCHCVTGTFNDTLTATLNSLEATQKTIAPTFLFIDPFGISQTPFKVIERFMASPKCEVIINFMYQFVNRFKFELPNHLDELFGTPDWREVDQCQTPADREEFLVSLYERQLRRVAQFVWTFRMMDSKNKTSYYLVYGTNHILGLEKMKDAMWKVSPSGDYSFSDRHAHQLFLFGDNPDLLPLRDDLLTAFRGQTIAINQVERFVITHTNYRKAHLKTQTLAPMERAGLITVSTPRNRTYTYPPATRITFAE